MTFVVAVRGKTQIGNYPLPKREVSDLANRTASNPNPGVLLDHDFEEPNSIRQRSPLIWDFAVVEAFCTAFWVCWVAKCLIWKGLFPFWGSKLQKSRGSKIGKMQIFNLTQFQGFEDTLLMSSRID